MTTPTHDLALARAERDAWQSTCEELHRAIAGANVEIEAHLGRCEAADQRTRSLDAALTAERETSRGLVAQVDTWRDTWARVETIVDEAFGPFPVWPVYDTICAMERGIHDGIRAAQELAAIRDLVAPGNPQGTVVDAVRSMICRWSTDASIARAEEAEREAAERDVRELRATVNGIAGRLGCAEDVGAVLRSFGELCVEADELRAKAADAELTKLRADLAELRARPVLTEDILRGALDAHGCAALTRKLFAHLGPVTLPAQDRAEELCRAYHERAADMDGHMVGRWQYHGPESQAICTEAMERALASLGAPPTSPTVAPPEVFAGASVEELVVQYLMAVDPGLDPGVARSMVSGPRRAGVAAVLARLKVTLVAPEFLRRIPLYTKHGPGGKGDPGICDAACVKCEAERIIARLTAGVPVTPERK